MSIITNRRGFLTGLGTLLITAPAIVRISSIMPVRAMTPEFEFYMDYFEWNTSIPLATWRMINQGIPYGEKN